MSAYNLIRSIFLYFCLPLLTAHPLIAGTPIEKFDRYAIRSMSDWQVPGAAIVVIKDGAVVFSNTYGQDITLNTPFNLGTLSGTLTSQGIIALADDEKLTIDDPLVNHIRTLFPTDIDYSEQLTLRDLMVHRTGIPHREGDRINQDPALTIDQVFQRISYLKPSWGLRYKFGYQSIMMIPLAKVIEKTTGKSWESYLKERVWSPMGMESTGTTNITKNDPKTPLGHPGLGINSTPLELTQMTKMLLAKGDYEGIRIFEEDSINQMFAPQIPISTPQDSLDISLFAGYGLGWVIQDYRGLTLYWHNGISTTDHTFIALFPERSLGILVFTNEPSNRLAEALGLRIADLYLGLESRDWTRQYLKRSQPLAFEKLRNERMKEVHNR
jgi:CubicO group peptidase (beta-lactamase class C family)